MNPTVIEKNHKKKGPRRSLWGHRRREPERIITHNIMTTYDTIKSKLVDVEENNDKRSFTASCPACTDAGSTKNSGHSCLTVVRMADPVPLLRCEAGCNVNEILASIGMKLSDIQPIALTENGQETEQADANKQQQSLDPARSPMPSQYTTEELLNLNFPALPWVVPDLLPPGLSLLAGPPKVGKSWLTMQCAAAVGSGGELFGQPVPRGRVLVFALEDSPRRLQLRLQKQEVSSKADIVWRWEWPGWEKVQSELTNESYKLVIIDTVSRVLGTEDQNDASAMTAAFDPWQRCGLDHDICILACDHTRKSADGNSLDRIRGSLAKAAVADAILILTRESGRQNATLEVTGRDVEEERSLQLEWDDQRCLWENRGNTSMSGRSNISHAVTKAIIDIESQGEMATTTRIAAMIGKDKGQVSKALANLKANKVVEKLPRIGRDVGYTVVGRESVNSVNSVNSQQCNGPESLTIDIVDKKKRKWTNPGSWLLGR